MPAIRDWTYNYNTSTTATTIACAVPSYQENDLLLAILSTDTGTQTWTSTGWTQLFSLTNTSNLAVMYRIAGASEPAEYTFTYTTAETANAAILAIMDVDTATPIDGYTNSNNTAARQAMPTRTTSRNNSLNIYAWNHGSTAVIPSAIEGPVTQIISKDGSAHVDGFAWNFQPTAGTTPNNIYLTVSGTTYNGLRVVITINPPSTGATIIPTYCAADNSTYVDPIHGTTAFNGNTAFAGTATTYWTSPLAGRTLANATASAATDFGINTYRSVGSMTGPTTANTYTGATLVLSAANRVNVTGKNVLIHTIPALPADLQTVYDTGLGKGVEVGMASSANNAKVWHVHGFNSPWGIKRTPIVINEANTSGVIDSRGTFDATLTQIFGFFTCGFLVSSDWRWTMIWLLDTTVVAGGTASNPVGIEDIVRVVSDGHERMSAVLQGKNQMLLLQPIQIGNGGTNPVYLDLNSTAIEFPEIYNPSKKQTYYCSVENVAGITYYAGANDTIKHRNSVISSASRYHWKIHSSSSTSATYDFSGLTVIGAGTITLALAITIDGLTINDYSTIDASNLTLNNSSILNPPNTNNSITINSSTTFNNCQFDVTTLSAGNYLLSTATPDKFSDCTFTGSASSGHAFRITTPGTYNLSGNTFTGFGANGTTSAAIFNDSGGAVTLNITGDGNTPTVRNGTGASTTVNNSVDITIIVKDESGGNVDSARVAIYKSSDMTEIMNTTTNGSGVATTTFNYVSDTPVIIRVRKSSTGASKYIAVQTSGTITTTGLTTTVTFVADNIAASSYTAQIATDFTVNTTTKTIRHTTGSTVYTVNDLYTWLMDYFDDQTLMDDTIPMTAQTPSEYTLVNGWFIDNTSTKYLKSGAIQTSGQASYNIHIITVTGGTYNDPVSGDITKTVVAGATSIGPLLDYEIISTGVSSKWYVRDTRSTPAQIASGTAMTITAGTGSGNNSANSLTGENTFSNIFTLGTLVSGTTLDLYQNDSQITPWWSSGHIDILVKVKEANVEIDSGNLTVLARKYSTLYDHTTVDASSGRNPVPLAAFNDTNNQTAEGTVAGYNDITITFGATSQDLGNGNGSRPYDVSINCAGRTLTQVYEYLKYVTRTGSSTNFFSSTSLPINGEYYQAVGDIRFTYTAGSGTFAEGDPITDTTSGATGYITSRIASSNTLVVRNTHGTFSNGDSIQKTGGGATGTINSVPDAITQSKQAPFGTFAGGKFFGARGVWIYNMHANDANNYVLIDSTNTTQTPPSTVAVVVNGLASGDRVSVFRTTGDNYTIDKTYISSHATANSSSSTSWKAASTIPSDTPSTGYIRLRKTATGTEERIAYTSWSDDTFTLSSAHSGGYGSSDSAYVPYIDEQATGASISKSVTYTADRYVMTVVRIKGIVPFTVKGQLTNTGYTATAIRTTDSIVQ